MKRLLALVATAGLAVGLYATTAGGGQQAVTPGQFAALKKQVAKIQKDVTALKYVVDSCIVPIGIVQFGDGQTAGYHYKNPDGSEILTTALDAAQQGQQPDVLMATIDSKCINANLRGLAGVKLTGHHATRSR